MARPNYSKMSTAKIKEKNEEIKVSENEVSVEETILEKTTSPSEEPTVVEEPDIKEKVIGIVANCQRLNVRKGPANQQKLNALSKQEKKSKS